MADGSLNLGKFCVDKRAVPVSFSVVLDEDLEGFFVTIVGDEPSAWGGAISIWTPNPRLAIHTSDSQE